MKRAGLAVFALVLSVALVDVRALAQDEYDVGEGVERAASPALRAQANAEPPDSSDPQQLAIFYHRRGAANRRLGNYARAIEDLKLALQHPQPKGARAEGFGRRFSIQRELGSAYHELGDRFAEIEVWEGVAREYQKSSLFNFLYARLRLMDALVSIRRWTEADAARREAEAVFAMLRQSRRWDVQGAGATALLGRYTAIFYHRQGNYAEAERRFRAALMAADEHVGAAQARYPAGHEAIRRAMGLRGSVMRSLADNLSTQGRYGEAESYAQAGLRDVVQNYGPNTANAATALRVIGWTKFQQGDVAGAETYYRRSLAAMAGGRVMENSVNLSASRAALGGALIAQGRWEEALTVFDARDRGLRSDAAQFEDVKAGQVGYVYALHKAGRSARAARMAESMIANQSRRTVPNRWYVAQLRGLLGIALAAGGRTADALAAFDLSVPEIVRRDQDDATVENTGYWRVFWQRVILEGYLDLLASLQRAGETTPGLNIADESFRAADMARGSAVQEAISATAARARLPDGNLRELARREQDTLNRAVALNQILAHLAAAPEDQRLNKVMADMRGEIERLRNEHAALRADIRKRYPEYAELIDPRPAGIAEVRNALLPGEALVSIYLGEAQSYVWTIAAGGKAAFRVVPVRRDEAEADVRELRRALDLEEAGPGRLRPFDLDRASKLYSAFFRPDETLWKDAKVLNVIPHGALGELPMGLLVTAAPQSATGEKRSYGDAPWLIRKAAIAQLPSASAFTALRRAGVGRPGREPFIGFGDPVFTGSAKESGAGAVRSLAIRFPVDPTEEPLAAVLRGAAVTREAASTQIPGLSGTFPLLSALPDTSAELKEIAIALKADPARDVYLNRQATEKNVKQAGLLNRRVVAFATHGIAPGEVMGLDQPALVLSNPALTGDTDNDGFLTMEEVLALKLDADWVVLSACNTASADGRASEAVSGLGRAFFYAGARSLLVSNWAVETTSARLLTTAIFKRQASDPALSRAEALRQSMLSLMSRTGPGGFSYAHPAFWAPFSLVGDGGR